MTGGTTGAATTAGTATVTGEETTMDLAAATDKTAATLRALHVPGRPLVLPNVWDAASARMVAEAGFPAVATGSAAIAAVLGYEDGEGTPPGEMFAAIARIRRVVDVPVTADVERGYGLSPAELVERLAEAGAVGCNLEDSDPRTGALVDMEEQADFLASVREAAPDLVVNARTDPYLSRHADPLADPLAEAVRRGRRYLEAGADCVYPIRAHTADLGALVEEIGGPVNALCAPGSPSPAALTELGVARISFGHNLHLAAHRYAERMVSAIGAGLSPYGVAAS
ncbi:isocitrate lyase/phosphoenolpyruvate mutase family protein [Microtetraspora sp. NBRC 16547]|uniref:isocitrate lyase/PEP mutase family protein n=1 Tax=Microtetraspora sp. NBRC 16547 TaxID=3030993 RepID=UPI0024A2231C|nr:isocitrate lyase/phosphoenolpyruvate mutase family protein [Microtetraspora sp. NBRC 16547]GLX00050.1 carboxyvinyl-carboxyphosphonate phosphorylmutase [Microtetraspora sp. NBRC 16547]